MRSPMFSNLGSALRNANAESALYRRWFPGAGQRGGGFAGMGFCDPSDPTCVGADLPITGTVINTDPATGELPTSSLYDQLIAEGVQPADAYQYDPTGAIAAGVDPSSLFAAPGSTIKNVTPGSPLTPAQLTAQQVAAQAALLKMVPAVSSAALTAAQLAAGLTQGTIAKVATTVCPSGYRSSTGACVQSSGQWFSFATNNQVMTFGAVILAAIIIVPALSGGGRRRR